MSCKPGSLIQSCYCNLHICQAQAHVKSSAELLSFWAISTNMDIAPFKLDIYELIADYDNVNFVRNFVCVMYMLTWMSYIVTFLTGRRTARHWLTSSEFGRQRKILIPMKADLRQTLVSSCSSSFCIVLVGVGFLERGVQATERFRYSEAKWSASHAGACQKDAG